MLYNSNNGCYLSYRILSQLHGNEMYKGLINDASVY